MSAIGVGLIGLGRHGMRYVRHLEEGGSEARLAAVCRRDAVQGEAFALQHGVRFHQDYRELIADPHVGAVIVVTPPALTASICMAAVQAAKPLLIEKPLACTGAVARAMVEAAVAAGVPLMTAQTLRFDSAIQALKAEVSTARPPHYLAVTYRLEPHLPQDERPGMLLEIGTHLFDLIRFVTEEDVVEVRCEMDRPRHAASESRALVSLQTSGGCPCLVDVSRVSAGRVGRVEWIGEQIQIHADWIRHRLFRLGDRQRVDEWPVPPCHTVAETIRGFVAALKCGGPMPITGWDGYKAVAIADACYASAASGHVARVAT